MVTDVINGDEMDIPNTPAVDEEFQAPNKFVYKWTDENRWKNIHRPLYIPDYIWPDTSDQDDPYGTGTGLPNTDGGGGDDWTKSVFDIDLSNGNSIIQFSPTMNIDVATFDAPYPNTWGILEVSGSVQGGGMLGSPFLNDPIAQYPLIANKGTVFAENRNAVGVTSTPPLGFYTGGSKGDAWFVYPQFATIEFDSAGPCMWIKLEDYLSTYALANKTECNMRITVTGQYVGKNSGASSRSVSLNLRPDNNINPNSLSDSVVTVCPKGVNGGVNNPETNTSAWKALQSWGTYVTLEGQIQGGYGFGDVLIEITDPGAAERLNPPVGMCCDPNMHFTFVAFDGPLGPWLRTIRHSDPQAISNSAFDDTNETQGVDVLSLVDGSPSALAWTCLWIRSDGYQLLSVDSVDTGVVVSRHLYNTFDMTSHSEVYNDPSNGIYDYKDYGTVTPDLGFAVTDICMSNDGTKLFTQDSSGNMRSYAVSPAWDLSSVDENIYDTFNPNWGGSCFEMTKDGRAILMAKAGFGKQFILTTPWDLTTAIDTGIERAFAIENPVDLSISADGYSLMVLDIPADITESFKLYNWTRNN